MAFRQVEDLVEAAYENYRAHLKAEPGFRGNVYEVPGTTPRMRAAIALASAWGQCVNGGPWQYLDNGVGHRRVDGGPVTAAMAAAGLVEAARESDPEVADGWIAVLSAVARVPDHDDHRRAGETLRYHGTEERFSALVGLGHGRNERFLAAALDAHAPGVDPFATAWRPAGVEGGVRYPGVVVDASRLDGNANAIIKEVAIALRLARVPDAEIDAFRKEARSGSYDKVLGTMMRWVRVEVRREDDLDEDHDEGLDGPDGDDDAAPSFAP